MTDRRLSHDDPKHADSVSEQSLPAAPSDLVTAWAAYQRHRITHVPQVHELATLLEALVPTVLALVRK